MAKYGILTINSDYEFTVKEIKEGASTFISRKPETQGQTMYCHQYILEDDDKIRYSCQVCDLKDTQNYCNPGDTMRFKVKAFTRDIHSIEFLARDGIAYTGAHQRPPAYNLPDPVSESIKQVETLATAKVISLQCAVTMFANRIENEMTGETVLDTAKKYYKYLTE